jgi:hypothetical protein
VVEPRRGGASLPAVVTRSTSLEPRHIRTQPQRAAMAVPLVFTVFLRPQRGNWRNRGAALGHSLTHAQRGHARKLALQSESAPGAPLLDLRLVLLFRSNSSASYTVVVMGPLHADANPIGLGSRQRLRRAVRAYARRLTHHADRSSSRAADPWRRRAESGDLRVAARLGGRRHTKDIQDAGREAAASRMQREAGRALAPALPSSTHSHRWPKADRRAPFSAVRILPFSSSLLDKVSSPRTTVTRQA